MSNVDLNERLYSENIYDVEGVPDLDGLPKDHRIRHIVW
jgi:hypothetical protein